MSKMEYAAKGIKDLRNTTRRGRKGRGMIPEPPLKSGVETLAVILGNVEVRPRNRLPRGVDVRRPAGCDVPIGRRQRCRARGCGRGSLEATREEFKLGGVVPELGGGREGEWQRIRSGLV